MTNELIDTIEMMNSEDYKERFKAEYYQVVIRYRKLKSMLDRWDNNQLEFAPFALEDSCGFEPSPPLAGRSQSLQLRNAQSSADVSLASGHEY